MVFSIHDITIQNMFFSTAWGPQSIAFSWFISGLIVVYGRYNELVYS